MSPVQERLRSEAASRVRAARPDLAGRYDLGSVEGLFDAQRAVAAGAGEEEILAAAVVRHVDLAAWARSTCEFALGLQRDEAAPWRRAFTRTVFLSGNPDNLRHRFPFAHVAADGSAAWTAPGPAGDSAGLRRLLKLFEGTARLPAGPDTLVEIPAGAAPRLRPPVHRELYLATAGCSVAEALVHLNHVLAEAVLDELIVAGDQLTLRQVPRLIGIGAAFAALRVVAEPHSPGRLKAAAGLTEEIPVA